MQGRTRPGDAATEAPLRVMLREDFETSFRSWGRPGLHGLVVYRIGRWARTRPAPVRIPLTILHRLLNTLVIRNLYGMEISIEAVIGRRVMIGHHQAVQVPAFCVLGDDSVLRHNVNIGFVGDTSDRTAVPHIGRGVVIGPGAHVLGPITIGDGAQIGPNAVVTMDVPPGASVITPPARILRTTTPPGRSPRGGADDGTRDGAVNGTRPGHAPA